MAVIETKINSSGVTESGLYPDDFEELVCSSSLTELAEGIDKLVIDSRILRIVEIDQKRTKDGAEMKWFGFETASGKEYSGVVGTPNPDTQTTDVPVMATTAWLSSPEGHNEHTMRAFLKNGSPFILVGAEGSYHPNVSKSPSRDITLAGSAGATLSFAHEVNKLSPLELDPVNRILIGESRGAMVGMGINALASSFEQDVLFSDLIAPCFPKRPGVLDLLRLSDHLWKEPVSLMKLFGRVALKPLLHYPATIDLHPQAIAHQALIWPAIRSGDAGALGQLVANDKIMHLTCFDDDSASMRAEWEKIFQNYPNVQITPLPGSHLTLADPETLKYFLARNQAYNYFRDRGGDFSGSDVFRHAHQLVAA